MSKNDANVQGVGGAPANWADTENQQPPIVDGVNAQVGAGNFVPLGVPQAVPLNPDMIMASATGGMFSFQAAKQYVTLIDEQRKTFTACFFKKMLHDEALRKAKEEAEAKQHQLTKDNLRKN